MAGSEELKNVKFHYLKSPDYRAIHVDGAIGGITPSGNVHMALFSERHAIPQMLEHPIDGEQIDFGKEVNRVSRGGIVREIDIDAVFDMQTAKNLRDWLDRQIKRIEGDGETG